MLEFVFTGTAGSSVRVIFNYFNRARGPPSPFRSSHVLLFFVLHLLVHHLTLPFVYDEPEQKSEHCSRPYFRPDREKGDNFFEFINLFLPFCLFRESAFSVFFFSLSLPLFVLLVAKILFFFFHEEDDKFSSGPCTLIRAFDTLSNKIFHNEIEMVIIVLIMMLLLLIQFSSIPMTLKPNIFIYPRGGKCNFLCKWEKEISHRVNLFCAYKHRWIYHAPSQVRLGLR